MSEDFAARLAEQLATDKTSGFRADIFEKLVLAFIDNDGTQWMRIHDVLRERGVLQQYLKRIKKRAHEVEGVISIGEPKGDKAILDSWRDAPVTSESVVPDGWGIDGPQFAIYRLETRTLNGQVVQNPVLVSYDPIVITRRLQQKENGAVFVELAWRVGARWHSQIYPREDVLSTRKIVECCARNGMPIASPNAHEVVQYLLAYEHKNRGSMGNGYAQTTMGWLGEEEDLAHHGFIVGDRQIGANGQRIEYTGDCANEFTSSGDPKKATEEFEAWRAAVMRAAKWPALRVALYASLAAPLVGIVGAPNTIVEFVGETSGGKSVAMKFARSAWCSAKAKLPTWNTTINGLEARAQCLNDLPFFIDDTADVPESKRRDLLGAAVYMLESGHTRLRATKDMGQRPTKTWRSIVLSTGEFSLADYVGTGGAAARVLSFWGPPLGDPSEQTGTEIASIMGELGKHYGHAGPMLVQWLCDNRERWDGIESDYQRLVASVRRTIASPAVMRLAETIALLEVTSKIVEEAIGLKWESSLMGDRFIVTAIDRAMQQASAQADKPREAWEYVMSVAASHNRRWVAWGDSPTLKDEPPGGWLGWRRLNSEAGPLEQNVPNDDGADLYAWHPSQLKRVLADGGFSVEATLKVWRQLGVLHATNDRITTSAKCAGGRKSHPVIIVKANKTKWDHCPIVDGP